MTTTNNTTAAAQTFPRLLAEINANYDRLTADTFHYIRLGWFPSWANEHHNDPDRGLKQHSTARRWEQRWIGRTAEVLLEVCRDGFWHGYTPEYIPVRVPDTPGLSQGAIIPVCLRDPDADGMTGTPETGPNT